MEKETHFGANRTGVQASPIDIRKMLDGLEQGGPPPQPDDEPARAERQTYIADSDALGSVPYPGTMTGVLKTGVDLLTGNRAQVLMDKLGERLAFERSGTRLYDALLTKCETRQQELPQLSLATLQRFREEEAEHFRLLGETIESLGGDPTAQTPCADLVGIESGGLMQVLADPRTSLGQCLHAMLTAELSDRVGWELLIALAREMGKDSIVPRFEAALRQEQKHLEQISIWHWEVTLQQTKGNA